MIVFYSDLDNTLIYSYKHNIGEDKIEVEEYKGRTISYMTRESYQLFNEIYKKILLVPTTTRTIEQYHRIKLGIAEPKFALVCNGGILLEDGKEDEQWYQYSKLLVKECREELYKAEQCMKKDKYRDFEVRNIRELFLFTKSKQPDKSIELLKSILDLSLVDVFSNKVKVYVIPKKINKGAALLRLQNKIRTENSYLLEKDSSSQRIRNKREEDTIIAAGDSEFDIPMLKKADIALAPNDLCRKESFNHQMIYCNSCELFSDFVLRYIKNFITDKNKIRIR